MIMARMFLLINTQLKYDKKTRRLQDDVTVLECDSVFIYTSFTLVLVS
jgi:hypothetical protein